MFSFHLFCREFVPKGQARWPLCLLKVWLWLCGVEGSPVMQKLRSDLHSSHGQCCPCSRLWAGVADAIRENISGLLHVLAQFLMDRPLSWQALFLGSSFNHLFHIWQHCVTNLGQADSPQIFSPEGTSHKARWDWWLCHRGRGFWDIYVHNDVHLKPAEESWRRELRLCLCNSAWRGVRASSTSSGRAGSPSASSAPATARPALILVAAPILSSLPASYSRPFSAFAASSDLCSLSSCQCSKPLPGYPAQPLVLLMSPVPLVSLHHQDPLCLCSPASLTSPSTLRAPPLTFYLFFPHASTPPAEPCPTPGLTAVWASQPYCSCTLGRILPSHLTGCPVPVLGLGIVPQSSPHCAAEPIHWSAHPWVLTGRTRASSAPAAFNPQLQVTRIPQTVGFHSGIIPSLPLICSPALPTVLLINFPSLCLHTFTLPMIGSAPFCLCSEIAP